MPWINPAQQISASAQLICGTVHVGSAPHSTGVPGENDSTLRRTNAAIATRVSSAVCTAEWTQRTRPVKLAAAESGSPLAAAEAAAALDCARFAQAGRLRTLKLPGRLLKLDSDGVTEPEKIRVGVKGLILQFRV